MFTLLRLFSDVSRVAYVLADDEETLLELLMRTPIAQDPEERVRRYLDKLVTRRAVVPPLSRTQRRALVEPALADGPARPPDIDRDASFRLDAVLDGRLTTPRAVGRFAPRYVMCLVTLQAKRTTGISALRSFFAPFTRLCGPSSFASVVCSRGHPWACSTSLARDRSSERRRCRVNYIPWSPTILRRLIFMRGALDAGGRCGL